MAVLAHADAAEIAGRLETIALPAHENLREPENGLVMVRGRIGGDGAPFNLGEATVSRAAVRLATGEVGFGYVLGRDRQKARMIALCDALIQTAGPCRTPSRRRCWRRCARLIASERKRKARRDRGDAGRFLHHGARRGLSDDDDLPNCRQASPTRCRRRRATFRSVMDAMARPGSVQRIAAAAGTPSADDARHRRDRADAVRSRHAALARSRDVGDGRMWRNGSNSTPARRS